MTEGARAERRSKAADGLLEVALALPPFATFTYRDPRRGERASARGPGGGPPGRPARDRLRRGSPDRRPGGGAGIEAVLEDEPALDPEVLELCRWAAGYYLAPLGRGAAGGSAPGRAGRGPPPGPADRGRGGCSCAGTARARRASSAWAWTSSIGSCCAGWLAGQRAGPAGAGRHPGRAAAAPADRAGLTSRWATEIAGRSQGRVQLWAVARRGGRPPASGRGSRAGGRSTSGCSRPARGSPLASLDRPGAPGPARAERAGAGAAGGALRPAAAGAGQPRGESARAEPPPGRGAGGPLEAALAERGPVCQAFVLQGVTGSGKTEVYLRLIAEARAAGPGRAGAGAGDRAHPAAGRAFSRRASATTWRCCTAPCRPPSGAPPGGGCAPARWASPWARARRCSRPCATWAWWSSTRSTTPRSSRRKACATTGATWPWCARSGPARWRCWARPRPRWRAYRNVELGRFRRLLLPTRANPAAAARPAAAGGDRRSAPRAAHGRRPVLQAAAGGGPARPWRPGEQTILFLNRRGFSPLVLCRACGHVLRCSQCAVSMTFHRARDRAGLPLLRPDPGAAARTARPARAPSSSGWAPAPSGWRAWCASTFPTRGWPGWIATAPAAAAAPVLEQVLAQRASAGRSTSWWARRW